MGKAEGQGAAALPPQSFARTALAAGHRRGARPRAAPFVAGCLSRAQPRDRCSLLLRPPLRLRLAARWVRRECRQRPACTPSWRRRARRRGAGRDKAAVGAQRRARACAAHCTRVQAWRRRRGDTSHRPPTTCCPSPVSQSSSAPSAPSPLSPLCCAGAFIMGARPAMCILK